MRTSLVAVLAPQRLHEQAAARRRRAPLRDRPRVPAAAGGRAGGRRGAARRRARRAAEPARLGQRTPSGGLQRHDRPRGGTGALGADAGLGARGRRVAPPAALRRGARRRRHLGEVGGELHPASRRRSSCRGRARVPAPGAALVRARRLLPRYTGIPRFPAVLRDLAVVVAEEDRGGRAARVRPAGAAHRGRDPVRRAAGPPIPAGKKDRLALAIRYRAADRTLTDAEADAAALPHHRRRHEALGAEKARG